MHGGGGGRRASRKFLLKNVIKTISVCTPLYGSVNIVFGNVMVGIFWELISMRIKK